MDKKTRVFISFDYDNDSDLKIMLVGQSRNDDSPFEIADWSVKEHLTGDWKDKVRNRIRHVDVVCVICGKRTDEAAGVSAELSIAKEEMMPYFLLQGRTDGGCRKPKSASSSDKIYDWTWPNLRLLIEGKR